MEWWKEFRGWPLWKQIPTGISAMAAIAFLGSAAVAGIIEGIQEETGSDGSQRETTVATGPAEEAAPETTPGAAAETTPADTTDAVSGAPEPRPKRERETATCRRFGRSVEDYDVLAGGSRSEYLVLLHKLQNDCPRTAKRLGLAGEGMPQCERPDQADCTYYIGP